MRRLLLACLVPLALAACGGGSSGPPAGSIKVTLSDYKIQPNPISATAGDVTFYLMNVGTQQHDLILTDSSGGTAGRSNLVGAGSSDTFSVKGLKAGTYTVFCDVDGHRQLGMEGKLQVT